MDLAALDSLYAQTEAKPKGDFESLPDGKYQVSINSVEMKTTKESKPMLAFQLKVLAGPQVGRVLFKNSVITENTIGFLKQDLTLLGWTETLSALSDPLARSSLLDLKVEVTQKTKPGSDPARPNVNVYFNRLLQTIGAVAGGAASDDAPF